MSTSTQDQLRLWPGVVLVALQWFGRFGIPAVLPEYAEMGVLGALAGSLAVFLWWIVFSKAPRGERWGVMGIIVLGLAATAPFLHVSIATGMMGMMFYLYALPVVCLALVAWAALSRSLGRSARIATAAVAILWSCGMWTLVRSEGIRGAGSDFAWRWSPTSEEILLARSEPNLPPPPSTPGPEPAAEEPEPVTEAPAEAVTETPESAPTAEPAEKTAAWPGFRGPGRNSVVAGVEIETDWAVSPPQERWRQPVGPGWSSFSVRGDRVYTQEQRGEEELVSCYDLNTGEPVWQHRDAVRFWEANAGAGPRATPTLRGDRVYALGATGVLNALDADTGAKLWSRDAADDTGAALPDWGFAGSPLVVGDIVIAAVSGAVAAYDAGNGELLWLGPAAGTGYSSAQLAVIDGVEQVLMVNGESLAGLAAADGSVLWQHSWGGYPIIQPGILPDGDILLAVDGKSGTRRISVSQGADGWSVEEQWTSRSLKPYFNDFVVHEGHAYGFDGAIMAGVELAGGTRQWKGGRYGNGQLLLLAEQDLLLVLTEGGELALVSATPDGFRELAKVPAIEGKTWNHPVLVGDTLLVRNDREMAAFRLPLAAEQASD